MFRPMRVTGPKTEYKKTTIQDGIDLCRLIFDNARSAGYFPALTGGLLYKDGERKDIDIVLYRHRQKLSSFTNQDFIPSLLSLGVTIISTHGFVTKCEWKGFSIDIFNPESIDDDTEYGDK